MTNLMIKIHNVETGEVNEREMNANELTQWETDQAETLLLQEAEAQKAADKAALLEKLGITEDEARLLLG
jgi:hypothetical protein